MPNQATCRSCGAVLRSETPLPSGTPIKCPSCQQVFRAGDMPSASLGIPAPVAPIPGPPQRRRRRVWLWILLPTLAALFLCCCAGPFGLVLYTKDNSLAGTWTLDVPETKKINDNPEVEKASYT